MKKSELVRVWGYVAAAYKELANELGVYPSDLISLVALMTPATSPATLALALNREYGIPLEEGLDIAKNLKHKLWRITKELDIYEELEDILMLDLTDFIEAPTIKAITKKKRTYAKNRPGKPGPRKEAKQK